MKNFFFYLGFSFLCTHELDAVANNEWQVLPFINLLPIEYGQTVFILLHVPLFSFLVSMIASTNQIIRKKTKFILSVFLAVHGVLHIAFMNHSRYEFDSILSNSLIFGGALCGITYLIINQLQNKKHT